MKVNLTEEFIGQIKPNGKQEDVRDTNLTGFMVRVNQKGTKTYYVEYAYGKRVKIGKFGQPGLTLKLARLKAQEILVAAKNGQLTKVPVIKEALTYGEYLDGIYYNYLKNNTKNPDDIFDLLRASFATFLPLQIMEINLLHIEKWKTDCLSRGNKASTINRNLGIFKAALNRAVELKVVPSNPIKEAKRMKTDKKGKTRYLSESEQKKILEILPKFPSRFQVMVIVSLHTGLRKGELLNLAWRDIFFDIPTEDGLYSYLTVVSEYSKNGDTDNIPLNATAKQALMQWKHDCTNERTIGEWVFTNPVTNKPFTNIRWQWDKFRDMVGLRGDWNFRWHDLRHDFASQLAKKGVALQVVKEVMRHKTLEMTLRYSHLQPKAKRDAVCTLD